MKRWAMMACALWGIQVSPAQAQDAVALAPTGEWDLGSGPESCWIYREFGNGNNGVNLRIETFGTNGNYRFFLRGKALPQRDSGLLQFHKRFNTESLPSRISGVLAASGNVPTLNFTSSLATAGQSAGEGSPSAFEQAVDEAAINELELSFSRGAPLALQLGSLGEPMSRLHACARQLPGKWGLDAAQQQSLRRRPTPIDANAWIGPETFPWQYLRSSQSVSVFWRLMIDEQGTPSDCIIQSPRFESAASAAVCQALMASARFEPALDASGEPVASYYTSRVFYVTKRRNGAN